MAHQVEIAINEDGYKGCWVQAEGMKADKSGWAGFFRWICGRGLDGPTHCWRQAHERVGGRGSGVPEAMHRRSTIHFYRHVFPAKRHSNRKNGGIFVGGNFLKKIRAKFVNKTSQFWGSSQQFKRREVGSRPIACLPPPSLLKKFVYCTIGMPSFTALGVLRCIERS